MRVGLLGEDATDCATLRVLIRRIARQVSEAAVGVDHYAGKGCSRLRRKAEAVINDFARQGCAGVVLLHDLDRNPHNGELNDETSLRRELEAISIPEGLQRLICIPVEELEAWFWSDPSVIEEIGRGQGDAHPSPHSLKKPKEALMRLSIGANRKPRYSTNDNARLADKLDLELCAQRCPSFRSLKGFIGDLVASARA